MLWETYLIYIWFEDFWGAVFQCFYFENGKNDHVDKRWYTPLDGHFYHFQLCCFHFNPNLFHNNLLYTTVTTYTHSFLLKYQKGRGKGSLLFCPPAAMISPFLETLSDFWTPLFCLDLHSFWPRPPLSPLFDSHLDIFLVLKKRFLLFLIISFSHQTKCCSSASFSSSFLLLFTISCLFPESVHAEQLSRYSSENSINKTFGRRQW